MESLALPGTAGEEEAQANIILAISNFKKINLIIIILLYYVLTLSYV